MAWNLLITGPAQKEFQKVPAKDQVRVKNALLAMEEDPFSGDIKRLRGRPQLGGAVSAITESSTISILKRRK
jgi:mRNA-degrading endonuclease RelE of RelBE toxin-antitoxin system